MNEEFRKNFYPTPVLTAKGGTREMFPAHISEQLQSEASVRLILGRHFNQLSAAEKHKLIDGYHAALHESTEKYIEYKNFLAEYAAELDEQEEQEEEYLPW